MKSLALQVKIGDVHNKWTVIGEPYEKKYWIYFPCRCACGTEKSVREDHLLLGESKGCRHCGGRGNHKRWSEVGVRFAHISWKVLRKLRQAVDGAVSRCRDRTHSRYQDWGGRGIEVKFDDESSFIECLLALPGHDDFTLELDRIDNDGHYELGNLRFVTQSESALNRRKRRTKSVNDARCV